MTTYNNKRFYLIATGLLIYFTTTSMSHAQDWTFDPILKAGWEIDDNAVLSFRSDEEVQISGYQGDISLNANYLTDTTRFSLMPRARIRRYDDADFDSTDYFVRMNLNHRGQSNTFGFRSVYEVESVRTAERAGPEFAADDLTDITSDDTGLVQVGGDREKIRLRPFWSYRISGRSAITAAVDYFDVDYEDVFQDVLIDYTDTKAELSYSNSFSNVTTGILQLNARQFRNDDEINEFDGFGFMLGFERALSEKTELRALVGIDNARFTEDGPEDESEWVADLSIIRTLETIRILAAYRRSISASSTRIPVVRDDFILNFSRRLSEKITANLGARAYQTNGLTGGSEAGRNYVKLTAGFGWLLSPTFLLEFEVSHTNIDRRLIGEAANSNQFGVWFVWRPNSPDRLR
jgi:hypothetical protein